MRSNELDYDLPGELIAQHPVEPRDASRLLVFDRASGAIRHRAFRDLPERAPRPSRRRERHARRPGAAAPAAGDGRRVEVLLLEATARTASGRRSHGPSRRLRAGNGSGRGPSAASDVELVDELGDGRWLVRLAGEPHGEVPLPPYIHEPLGDPERYQTVYAHEPARRPRRRRACTSAARCSTRGSTTSRVELHVGLDTFRPHHRGRPSRST